MYFIFREGCRGQQVSKWRSWPALGRLECLTPTLKLRDTDSLITHGLVNKRSGRGKILALNIPQADDNDRQECYDHIAVEKFMTDTTNWNKSLKRNINNLSTVMSTATKHTSNIYFNHRKLHISHLLKALWRIRRLTIRIHCSVTSLTTKLEPLFGF